MRDCPKHTTGGGPCYCPGSAAAASTDQPDERMSVDDLISIACRMAQDLQEYVDAGEESGSDMRATKALLEEWEETYRRTHWAWQNKLVIGDGDMPIGLAGL